MKKQATIHCGLCNTEIYNGRSISNAAYKALQRHVYIDHAENNKNGAAPKGNVVFREGGATWTMALGINLHEWDAEARRYVDRDGHSAPIPQLPAVTRPFPTQPRTCLRDDCHCHQTLDEAREAYEKEAA